MPEIGCLLGREREPAAPGFQGPLAVIWVVIPLPDIRELWPFEGIAAGVGCRRLSPRAGCWFDPRARGAPNIAGETEHRPAILPRDGGQTRQPPDGIGIHHRVAPPLAVFCVHNSALVDGGCDAIPAWIRSAYIEFAALVRAEAVALRDSESLSGADGVDDLIWTKGRLCTCAGHPEAAGIPSTDDVIHPVYFEEVRTLAHDGIWAKGGSFCPGDDVIQGVVELGDTNIAVTPRDVLFAIIVEQHG